jgi:hypothetical protein
MSYIQAMDLRKRRCLGTEAQWLNIGNKIDTAGLAEDF